MRWGEGEEREGRKGRRREGRAETKFCWYLIKHKKQKQTDEKKRFMLVVLTAALLTTTLFSFIEFIRRSIELFLTRRCAEKSTSTSEIVDLTGDDDGEDGQDTDVGEEKDIGEADEGSVNYEERQSEAKCESAQEQAPETPPRAKRRLSAWPKRNAMWGSGGQSN